MRRYPVKENPIGSARSLGLNTQTDKQTSCFFSMWIILCAKLAAKPLEVSLGALKVWPEGKKSTPLPILDLRFKK